MKNIYKSLILISLLFIVFSCEKNYKDTLTETIEAKVLINNILCYPNDSISLEFELSIIDGKEPYIIQWINPENLTGIGPFTISLNEDLLIDVIITDLDSTQIEYMYQIKKDTIDSLVYDYRNPYLGYYACQVVYQNNYSEPKVDSTYYDTLCVSKNEMDFTKLIITPTLWPSVYFDFTRLRLDGYRSFGRFYNDSSLYYYEYMNEAFTETWEYNGNKIY